MATRITPPTARLLAKVVGAARQESLPAWIPALTGSALVMLAARRRSPVALAAGAAGGMLGYAAVSGRARLPGWLRSRLPATDVERVVTILRPQGELFSAWRDFEQLPRLIPQLESVTRTGDDRWHWVARGPAAQPIEWDADVCDLEPDQRIRWRSLPGSAVTTTGEIRFSPAPLGRGTEVRLRLHYTLPLGEAGAGLAWLLGAGVDRQVRESLRRFKQVMETGEVPTNDHQP